MTRPETWCALDNWCSQSHCSPSTAHPRQPQGLFAQGSAGTTSGEECKIVTLESFFTQVFSLWTRTLLKENAPTLRRAGAPYFCLYDLRSTYATRLSAGGVADEWVTQLLRWGDS